MQRPQAAKTHVTRKERKVLEMEVSQFPNNYLQKKQRDQYLVETGAILIF